MAQRAKTGRAAKGAPAGRPRGRPVGSKSKKLAPTPVALKPRRQAAVKPVASPRKLPTASVAPKLSKGELQAQVEKLERTVATLRSRSREAVRAAKQAAARIGELEAQLAAKEQQALKEPAAVARVATRKSKRTAPSSPAKATASAHDRRANSEPHPGDGLSSVGAVETPEALEEEVTTASGSLETKHHPPGE